MDTDRKWVVVRIDGKLAAVSDGYGRLAGIAAQLAAECRVQPAYGEITAATVGFDEVLRLKQTLQWDDMLLFGTAFQKKVWRTLWEMDRSRILSYSDFAELCENKSGVRAVAHAIGLNPIPIIIPCHLVVPKEAIDKIREIQKRAESTIFKGEDLSMKAILEDPGIDFGEYALGHDLKKTLISMDLTPCSSARNLQWHEDSP